MKKKLKNVLVFAITSSMADFVVKKLLEEDVFVYGTKRSDYNFTHKNLRVDKVDLSNEDEINAYFNSVDVKFDAVICFQGVAISSPVEFLDKRELQKQLDNSLFSYLYILKNLPNKMNKDGIVIGLSSMAAFGIYPFLAPYSISKSSVDTLLNCFEIETGIKTVSIKPGVVGTKFWQFSVRENEKNFEKFKDRYYDVGIFLKKNALKNANRGLSPEDVSKLIYNILYKNNPKTSYCIGIDSIAAKFVSNFKSHFLNSIIRKFLGKRMNNER